MSINCTVIFKLEESFTVTNGDGIYQWFPNYAPVEQWCSASWSEVFQQSNQVMAVFFSLCNYIIYYYCYFAIILFIITVSLQL
jgi:hypothetical protein